MPIEGLDEAAVAEMLAALPDWRRSGMSIERRFKFKDFSAAWGFMTRVALLAEQQDHHPDWSNSYNEVVIALSTHAAKGLTKRDERLALAIDLLG